MKINRIKSFEIMFLEHINDKDDYNEMYSLYYSIKKAYMDKINNGEVDIKIEKVRLERDVNISRNLSVTNYMSFALLGITVLTSGIISATQYNSLLNNYFYILTLTVIMFVSIMFAGYSISKDFLGGDKKSGLYKLCLRILEDIECELEEKNAIDNKINFAQEIDKKTEDSIFL